MDDHWAMVNTTKSEVPHLRAYWLDRQTVALPRADFQPNYTYQLLGLALTLVAGLTPEQLEKYPQLSQYAIFNLPESIEAETLKSGLKGEVTVTGFQGPDMKYVTGVQIAGALDDLFYFNGKLGPQFANDQYNNISVSVWAPTAQSVKLLLLRAEQDTDPADVVPMLEANGVWSAEIENSWLNHYYLFSVKLYVPSLKEIVENEVTDPYSTDLALNGIKSRLTDLSEANTKPEGWDQHRSPELGSVNELSIWEVHVREFSINDMSVPGEQRGTYLAFANQETNGMRHLRRLAKAGLKAAHLMPTFHIASIDEDKSTWKTPGHLSNYPPDGTEQQAAVEAVRNGDAFNWGYDPVHYMAPEGAYALNPNERVKEYRAMVEGLHRAGLRGIQDVVFNHTSAHGQERDSVLDKIVPGYYYRLDGDGNVLNNTCCSDTASEHRMMEKLMIDCVVQNACQYKIDGFRFDLMGYHSVSTMQRLKGALNKLTVENDGVDGLKIYVYGEGWGSNAPGPIANQLNLYGCGIGTFNDRIRDGVRGGGPFSDHRMQGFATGLYTNPNAFTQQTQSESDQINRLMDQSDWIRAGLAGNMREFSFTGSRGQTMVAGTLDYDGKQTGYTASPVECVNYCSVHDNLALFDAIQLKAAASDDIATRVRRQILAVSLVALGQGIPFFYSGDELLRSKDMDENSYDSGDWFNKLDFTYQSNNWGTGLPLAATNQQYWPMMQPLLANPALKPSAADIRHTREAFEALLEIRSSSQLFHMQTLAEVQRNLTFLHTQPGVIGMRLDANGGTYSGYQHILVVFNATGGVALLQEDWLKTLPFTVHPASLSAGEFDQSAGTVKVPAITTAVLVAN